MPSNTIWLIVAVLIAICAVIFIASHVSLG